ncbi:MAG: hypothetical protein ACK5NF_01235 [Bacilli bacterium]
MEKKVTFYKYRLSIGTKNDNNNITLEKPCLNSLVEYIKNQKTFSNESNSQVNSRYYIYDEMNKVDGKILSLKDIVEADGTRHCIIPFRGGIDDERSLLIDYNNLSTSANPREETQVEMKIQHLYFIENKDELFLYVERRQGMLHFWSYLSSYSVGENKLTSDLVMEDNLEELIEEKYRAIEYSVEQLLISNTGHSTSESDIRQIEVKKAKSGKSLGKNWVREFLKLSVTTKKKLVVINSDGKRHVLEHGNFQQRLEIESKYNTNYGGFETEALLKTLMEAYNARYSI